MIPRLEADTQLPRQYLAFLAQLQQQGFSGDISPELGQRIVAATDNSIYQALPQAVIYPRHEQDMVLCMTLLAQPEFTQVQLSPRGGGTGTNGQSLTTGIILDCSRHMNQILELNLEQGWVRVQAGVVLDQLNEYLQPHKVYFSPNLSPSDRATLGGMASTDACGKGSRLHGRTSDHTLQLRSVFRGGVVFESQPINEAELEQLCQREDVIGDTHRQVAAICRDKAALIEQSFPKLSRFMSGYNLAHVFKDGQFNLNPILIGSEGTLALFSEITLKLTPVSRFKKLAVVKYANFEDTLKDAANILKFDPYAIESADEQVIDLARNDIIYHEVKDFIADANGIATRTVNLVEYISDDEATLNAKIAELTDYVNNHAGQPGYASGIFVTDKAKEIGSLWNLRKKGVGILGSMPGKKRPMPFMEDTAVPPEHLANYIADLKVMLDDHQLKYGMFGHVDVGCLHVRPAVDLTQAADRDLIRTLSDATVALVKKYQGVMWGEHGRGYRAEYGPDFFGEELFQDLRRIKSAFDPNNQLNPGKICTPLDSDATLVKVDDITRGHANQQIAVAVREAYDTTINCNGNSACTSYKTSNEMCPSYKSTRQTFHSPKGRANLVREWLRQLSEHNIDPLAEAESVRQQSMLWAPFRFAQQLKNSAFKAKYYDFSHEVKESMDGCLACKACATQCPIKVNVPSFRSRFLELYYQRYARPVRDYMVAWIEHLAALMSYVPKLTNSMMGLGLTKWMLRQGIGMVDMPNVSEPSLRHRLISNGHRLFDLAHLKALPEHEKRNTVLIVQDPFTSYFDADVVYDVVRFIEKIGYNPIVLPFKPNGKASHVKGFIRQFVKLADKQSRFLNELAQLEIPMIGIDPSLVLCYRDEYKELLGEQQVQFKVALIQEWLLSQLDKLPAATQASDVVEKVFCHCTEKSLAPTTEQDWRTIFSHFGIPTEMPKVGCCGMCGTFGHEAHHAEQSKQIFQQSWEQHIPAESAQREQVSATGYSCRSQVKRIEGFKPKHPVQRLLQQVQQSCQSCN